MLDINTTRTFERHVRSQSKMYLILIMLAFSSETSFPHLYTS